MLGKIESWARHLLRILSPSQKYLIFLSLDLVLVVSALALAVGPASLLPVFWPTLLGATFIWAALGLPRLHLLDYDALAFGRVGVAVGGVTLVLAVWAMMHGFVIPPVSFALFASALFGVVAVSRILLLQVVLMIYRRGHRAKRVVIYGAGRTGTELVQALRTHRSITPVAFVDDNTSLQGRPVAGLPVLAPGRLAEFAREQRIHRVLLAMPSLAPPRRAAIARRLQDMGIEVHSLPTFAQLIGVERLPDALAPLPGRAFLGRSEVTEMPDLVQEGYGEKSVLVSGAGGSIGSQLCRNLIYMRPRRLVLLESAEPALFQIHEELRSVAQSLGVEVVPCLGSVTDAGGLDKVLRKYEVEVILHAAAYKHVALVQSNPLAGLSNNTLGTQVLADAAVRAGVERFILISTDKAVRPAGLMGASKRLAELVVLDQAARAKKTVFAMVRFGNVLGSSGSVIPIFQDQIRRGGPVTVTHPLVTRYFMTIEEAARLVIQAGAMAEGGEVFILDMGEPVRITDLARQTIEAAGYTVQDDRNPGGDIAIRYIGLRPGEKLHEELFIDGSERPTENARIFRARDAAMSEFETAEMIRDLRRAVDSGDEGAALAAVERRLGALELPALSPGLREGRV